MERASAGGISGGLLRHQGFCTPWLSSSGVAPTVQLRNLDPGIGAQRGGEGPQSGLEAGPFSRACSRRGGWAMRERWTSPVQSWLRLHPGRSHRLCSSEAV